MDELDALEEDLAAEAESGAVPSYLQEDTLPDVPAGVTEDPTPVNPEAPAAYPAIQTDEYGLPVAPSGATSSQWPPVPVAPDWNQAQQH